MLGEISLLFNDDSAGRVISRHVYHGKALLHHPRRHDVFYRQFAARISVIFVVSRLHSGPEIVGRKTAVFAVQTERKSVRK